MGVLGPLRALWGALGALLGPCWAPLGALFGNLFGRLGASQSHRKRKGENDSNIDFLAVVEPFWPLGWVLGRLG
eukprot:1301134-Pyramimonas_sp.AAC.1